MSLKVPRCLQKLLPYTAFLFVHKQLILVKLDDFHTDINVYQIHQFCNTFANLT